MKIGVDASRIESAQRTGVENFAFFVIEELKKILPSSHEVMLYGRAVLSEDARTLPAHWRHKILYMPGGRLWTQVRLSLEMLLHTPDVLLVPAHVMPLVHPKKTVVVIHDVAPERFPESYSWWERMFARWATKRALARAWKIVVPSAFTKRELVELFAISDERAKDIVVVPLAYDHTQFHTGVKAVRPVGVRDRYALFVGRLEDKKDVVTLVRAYDLVRARGGEPFSLVLAGKSGYGYAQVRAAIDASAYHRDIHEIGFVSGDALPGLYAGASVFCFATKYEGFGIPVLEAAACGTPVIIRKGNATEEIAPPSVLRVDASVESLADVLSYAMTHEQELRAQMVVPGYSWEKTGEAIARVLLQ